MRGQIPQKPKKRTAQNLRDTGANELEKIIGGKNPRTIEQYLGHTDKRMARAYRDEETAALFEATDKLGELLKLG